MQSYTVRQTISQFTGHPLALPTTINFYYVESASDALAKAVQQSGLAADLLEVTENEVVPMGTSLRQFEDWRTDGDDQIRAGFPAMALSDDEIATRQTDLDAQRARYPKYPAPCVGGFNRPANSCYISDAEMADMKARVARRQDEKEQADLQTRLEQAAHNLEIARAEFTAAAAALRAHKQAELARRREFALARQQERDRRNSAQLGATTGFSLMR